MLLLMKGLFFFVFFFFIWNGELWCVVRGAMCGVDVACWCVHRGPWGEVAQIVEEDRIYCHGRAVQSRREERWS
jgi:hypothetical protein